MVRCVAILCKDFLRSTDPHRETRCRRNARYVLEGNNLCAEHASLILLKQAREAGVIKSVSTQ
jgi:hypothetical protein